MLESEKKNSMTMNSNCIFTMICNRSRLKFALSCAPLQTASELARYALIMGKIEIDIVIDRERERETHKSVRPKYFFRIKYGTLNIQIIH